MKRNRRLASAISLASVRRLTLRTLASVSVVRAPKIPRSLTARTSFYALGCAGWTWTGSDGRRRTGLLVPVIRRKKSTLVDCCGPLWNGPWRRGWDYPLFQYFAYFSDRYKNAHTAISSPCVADMCIHDNARIGTFLCQHPLSSESNFTSNHAGQ